MPEKLKTSTLYLNYAFILYAFCIPLSRAGIVFSSILIIVLWIIEGNFKSKFKILKDIKFILFSIILTCYLLLSVFWSDSSSYNYHDFDKFWYYLPFFAITTSLKKKFLPYLLYSFIFAMSIDIILSYGMFLVFSALTHGTAINPTPFMNHLEYSILLAVVSLVFFNKLILTKSVSVLKITYLIMFIISTINLFLIQGRIGQLSFFLSIFILIIFYFKNKFKAFFYSITLISIILFSSYHLSDSFKYRLNQTIADVKNVIEKKDFSGSWGIRASAWVVTYNILKDNILFGTGIADLDLDYKRIIEIEKVVQVNDTSAMYNGGYHNEFLELTAAGGLISFLLFIIIFYYLSKIEIKDLEIRNIKIFLLVVLLFSLLGDNFLRLQFTMNLFSLFIGIILAQEKLEKSFQV